MGTEVRTAPMFIAAPPDEVWATLVDLPGWKRWSPRFRISARRLETDARTTIHIGFLPGPTVPAPGKILVVEPNQKLSWGGGIPGVLSLDHGFELSLAAGGTQVVHYETFDGVLGGGAGLLRERVLAEYERMNAGLRDEVEARSR